MSDIVSKPCNNDCQDTWDRVYGLAKSKSQVRRLAVQMDLPACESCGLRLPDVEARKDRKGNDVMMCNDCFGETTED